ncbi:5'-3' exonuclease [Hamadaea tsunoensis]|uniref:5'-3' exonuclease n=1 Tax=Hamadaea tsunoensis TaxID=53368 RepID=UPI000480C63C|nr:5'-3' exonuclease H3TH domain-containing protein [Hamadaea tsunoensis]
MPPNPPLLLTLDGNSLLHRAYHAAAGDPGDRAAWGLQGLVGYLARAAARLRPDAVIVGFDCSVSSARRSVFPDYKAHRPPKPDELVAQLAAAPEVLAAAGIAVVVPAAYEADDVLASSAAAARQAGWRSVLMTSDRDAFALLDAGTSVLRVRNGGFDQAVLVTPEELDAVYGVAPAQYRDYAALRGDPSDNLHGVRGFGSATAARLLASFGTVDAAWSAWDGGHHQRVRDCVGDRAAEQFGAPAARAVVERNRQIMAMRDDLDLPALPQIRRQLNVAAIRSALIARGITPPGSLWALTRKAVAAAATPVPQQWSRWRGAQRRREPIPGQLSLF